jgi:8-oxo-dGTP pyrophosphatase MutT (NUDIX family)
MRDAVERAASREVYRNPWMSVHEDDVLFADGSSGIYGVVRKPDFALIVPRDAGRLHLVEQYRYPVGARYWEFPQGSCADGAAGSPLDLARRELLEETGLTAALITFLGRTHVAYGYSSQRCHVFLAEGLRPGRPRREASESDMRQRAIDRAGWERLVADGRITDAASLAAYGLLTLHDARTPDGRRAAELERRIVHG